MTLEVETAGAAFGSAVPHRPPSSPHDPGRVKGFVIVMVMDWQHACYSVLGPVGR